MSPTQCIRAEAVWSLDHPMGEATRDQILDSAERLMGRLGYQKMTMDDIAREAGIGRRTIYLHFPSKEEVALAKIDRTVDRLKSRLSQIQAAHVSWSERLRRMLLERVLFRFDSVRDYYHSIDDIFRSLRPAYMARRSRYFAEEAAIFAAVLTAGRACGRVRFRRRRRDGKDAAARHQCALAVEPEHPRTG